MKMDLLDEKPLPLSVEMGPRSTFFYVIGGGILVAARYPVRSSYYDLEYH